MFPCKAIVSKFETSPGDTSTHCRFCCSWIKGAQVENGTTGGPTDVPTANEPHQEFRDGIFCSPSHGCILTCLCIPSIEGHPNFFKFLAIMKRAALHNFRLVFVWMYFFKAAVQVIEVWLLEPKVKLVSFGKTVKLFQSDRVCIPPAMEKGSYCSSSPSSCHCHFWCLAVLVSGQCYLILIWNLLIKYDEHIFLCLFAICPWRGVCADLYTLF